MEAAPDDMSEIDDMSTSPTVAAANSLFASAAEPAAPSSPGAPAKAQPASAWATIEHSGSALSLAGEDEVSPSPCACGPSFFHHARVPVYNRRRWVPVHETAREDAHLACTEHAHRPTSPARPQGIARQYFALTRPRLGVRAG
jgi:hypothetical protein